MADKAIFEIIVTNKGLKINQKGVDDLGASVERTKKKTEGATKASGDFYNTQAKGVIGTANSTKSFSKLAETIGGGGGGLVGAYATLAANAFAVSAAFNVLRRASATEQVLKGLEIQGARLGVTLTNTAMSVRALTGDMLSTADAMRAVAQASAAGFSQESIESLASLARDTSVALGRDLGDALDRLIKGTTKLEPELLDELGIMTKLGEATAVYALQTGKTVNSLTSFEKRQAFLNAVLQEGEDKFAGIGKQIEADPYQKLASTFSDLIQKVLELVDALGASTIVKALADNVYLLGAALLYFASTISRSLLPGLYAMSSGSQETATQLANLSRQKYLASAAAEKLAVSQGNLELQQARTLNVTARSAGLYTTYVNAVKSGTATDKMRSDALRSLTASIKYYDKQAAKFAGTQKGIAASDYSAILRDQKAAILNLGAAEEAVAKRTEAAIRQTTLTRREAARVRVEAAAASKAATGIELLGQGQISEGWKNIKQSVIANFAVMRDRMKPEATQAWAASTVTSIKQVSLSMFNMSKTAVSASISFMKMLISPAAWAAGAARAFTLVKASMLSFFATATSGQGILAVLRTSMLAAGTAAVTFGTMARAGLSLILFGIPILGQIILLLQVLYEVGKSAWEWMFPPSEAQKALEKAQENFEATMERASETGKVTTEVFADAYSSVTSNAQAYQALSNTVLEVSENLKKLRAAREQLNQAEAESTKEALNNVFRASAGRNISDEVLGSAEFEAIEKLANLGFAPLTKEIEQSVLQSKEFQKASKPRQIEILANAVDRLGKKFASVGQAVNDLRESYKKLSDSTQQFIKASTPTTPYDGLVEGLTASAASIASLRSELAKGTITAEDFNKQISAIPEQAATLLDANAQKQIQQLSTLNAQIAAAEIELAKSSSSQAERESAEARINSLRTKQLDLQRKSAEVIESSVMSMLDVTLELQKQAVVQANMLKLEQSRLSTVKESLEGTGAGFLALQAQEEKMRAMNVATIRANQEILKQLNLQAEAKLNQAKSELEGLEARVISLRTLEVENTLWGKILDKIKQFINWTGLWDFDSTSQLEKIEAEASESMASVIRLRAEVAQLNNSILASSAEIAAIMNENLTEAQKGARALQIDFQNIARLAESMTGLFPDTDASRVRLEESRRPVFMEALSQANIMISAGKRQVQILGEERRVRAQNLENAIELNRANIASGKLTGIELKAAEAKEKFLKEELEITNKTYEIRQKLAQQNLILDLADKYRLNTLTTGLEIQMQALDLMRREYDLKLSIVDKDKELNTLRSKRLLRGVDGSVDPEVNRAIEARAAFEAFKIAKDQFDLRMASIDAEYALLEAQTIQTKFQLQLQQSFLKKLYAADGVIDAQEQTALDQLDATISNISRVDFSAQKALAKEAEFKNLQVLQARAREAASPLGGIGGGLFGGVLNFGKIFETGITKREREKILTPLDEAIKETSKVVLPDLKDAANQADQALDKFDEGLRSLDFQMSDLVDVLSKLTDSFNVFLKAMGAEGSISTETVSTGQVSTSLVARQEAALKSAQRARSSGLEVAEFSAWGKVGKHSDPGHFNATAYDLRGGTSEKIEAEVLKAVKEGATAIWKRETWKLDSSGMVSRTPFTPAKDAGGDKWHDRHAHISFKRALQEAMPQSPRQVAEEVVSELPAVAEAAGEAAGKAIVEALRSDSTSTTVQSVANDNEKVPEIVAEAKGKRSFESLRSAAVSFLNPIIEDLKSLGPDGEVLVTALEGIKGFSSVLSNTFDILKMSSADWKEATDKDMTATEQSMARAAAVAQAVSQAIGLVSSLLNSQAESRLRSIDREIAAEQKRDGKSSESVSKIESLTKKKDDIARKSFNVQKKLQLAQAVINTAAGITMALATLPPPYSFIMAGLTAAMGAAQIAVISSSSYEGGSSATAAQPPSTLSIGRRGDIVDLARGPSANAGGEAGFIRGSQGTGTNANNFRTIGSAYGGDLMRGYGNRGFVVGEKGPEVITPETPINVTPANDVMTQQPLNATFNIQALDASGVEELLVGQKGNIIKMLRDAANASGQGFLEDVNVNVYTRPNIAKL
jgi:hypothetical protein